MNTVVYTKKLLRQFNYRSIPTQVLLCIAALLGCVSILLASTNLQSINSSSPAYSSQIIVIIPAGPQKVVALPLPD
jgi:hypothetical protein